jgi:hypothetical protein
MPTTLRNTDILFNDGSTQSTAAVAWPGVYTGSAASNTSFPVGTTLLFNSVAFTNNAALNNPNVSSSGTPFQYGTGIASGFSYLAGTWRARGSGLNGPYPVVGMAQRVA